MPQRLFIVGGLTALAVLGLAGAASAHVTANPSSAEQGAFTKVSFRVPNEETSTDTTKIEVDLPLDHPIAAVSVRPVPGWKISVVKSKLPKPIKSDDGETTQAVSQITWSGGSIVPGQFQEFEVSMGPLPTDTTELRFKAVQTYSDGTVVNWADASEEDEHPAPVVHLTAKGVALPATVVKAESALKSDGTARLLGVGGLVVGVVGLGVGGLALARNRS